MSGDSERTPASKDEQVRAIVAELDARMDDVRASVDAITRMLTGAAQNRQDPFGKPQEARPHDCPA